MRTCPGCGVPLGARLNLRRTTCRSESCIRAKWLTAKRTREAAEQEKRDRYLAQCQATSEETDWMFSRYGIPA